MRIRQIKPTFWRDALCQKELSPTELLIYVGLWMEADDAGWFRLSVPEIAADIWPYKAVADREAEVSAAIDHLAALARIKAEGCGRHAVIPTLPTHQRVASESKRVYMFRSEHAEKCVGGPPERHDPVSPADGRGGERDSGDFRTERNGTERIGKGREGVPGPTTSLDDVLEAIRQRWGWTLSPEQRALVWEVADHHAHGSAGFDRLLERLAATDALDPIAFLKVTDRQLKETGLASALSQERKALQQRAREAGHGSTRPDGIEAVGDILGRSGRGTGN